jgi:hypothetical protein
VAAIICIYKAKLPAKDSGYAEQHEAAGSHYLLNRRAQRRLYVKHISAII